MKTILLPFQGKENERAAFASAVSLARKFDAYIEGLFVRQLPPIIAGEGITLPGDYISHLTAENEKQAEHAAQEFRQWMDQSTVPVGEFQTAIKRPCAGWRETEGLLSQVIAEYGRSFDVMVIGRNNDGATDWKIACESALFDSGRPILLAAESVVDAIGENVVVVCSGSTETTRAIQLAMPFLRQAESVTLFHIEGARVPGPTAEDVHVYLARYGIDSEVRHFTDHGRSAGEVALDEARSINADLLVKGAYTHSRLRAMIFGTVTSHILAKATIPVFLAH